MKVFLTGGTGFIGKSIVRAICKRGWQAAVLVRRPESPAAKTIESLGAQLFVGDISDRETMREGMQGADIVIHNAAWYEYGVPGAMREKMRQSNVLGTENTLGLAVELGIPRITYVSSIIAHGRTGKEIRDETYQSAKPPLTTYELTKTEAHRIAKEYQKRGAPVIIASPGAVIGAGDHAPLGYYARLYVRGFGMPLLPKGSLPFVHVDDCAEGIVLAAEKGCPGEEYIISAGVQTIKEMFETWKKFPGAPKFMIWLPRGIGDVLCIMTEPLERLFRLPVIISREAFLAASFDYRYSGEKSERELGVQYRSPEQAWQDALAGERERANNGKSWRSLED